MNLNEKMLLLGSKRSIIREIFEYSKVRSSEIGAENVFDFSLGNPSVKTPDVVNENIIEKIKSQSNVHGYTSAQGDFEVRSAISSKINREYGIKITPSLIYMTCGAAASLTISLKSIVNDGDEVIVFAPYFTEYKVFIENAGAKMVVVSPNYENFSIDFSDLSKKISVKTKSVIINSPNNPSGVVYSENDIKRLSQILKEKQKEFSCDIVLISDEPYREIVYGSVNVPYIMNYYDNSLVCYSFSKSLSLPGERIGYIAVNPSINDAEKVYNAICGAGRSMGYVCAPSLFQYALKDCLYSKTDVDKYKENRDILYNSLTEIGFKCVEPMGAFYLMVKAPTGDAFEFYETAKKYEILFVPCDDFGIKGYVRIAYCVDTEKIKKSIKQFEKMFNENYK